MRRPAGPSSSSPNATRWPGRPSPGRGSGWSGPTSGAACPSATTRTTLWWSSSSPVTTCCSEVSRGRASRTPCPWSWPRPPSIRRPSCGASTASWSSWPPGRRVPDGSSAPTSRRPPTVLRELRAEMEERYTLLLERGLRKVDRDSGLGLIVVVIDELALYTQGKCKARDELRRGAPGHRGQRPGRRHRGGGGHPEAGVRRRAHVDPGPLRLPVGPAVLHPGCLGHRARGGLGHGGLLGLRHRPGAPGGRLPAGRRDGYRGGCGASCSRTTPSMLARGPSCSGGQAHDAPPRTQVRSTSGGWSTGSSPGSTAPGATTRSPPRCGPSGAAGARCGCPVGSRGPGDRGRPEVLFDTRQPARRRAAEGVRDADGRRSARPVPPSTGATPSPWWPRACEVARRSPRSIGGAPGGPAHPHRPQLRGRPPAAARRDLPPVGTALSPRAGPRLWPTPRQRRRGPRPGPLPRLLRLRGSGAVQRRGLRALAADHHLRPPGPRFAARA